MKKWSIAIGLVALAITIAFCISHAVFKANFSYSLDFGAVIDAFVLLVVFIMFDYLYSQQSSDKRVDTDLLLGIIEEAKSALHRLEEEARACESGVVLTDEQMLSLNCEARELSNSVHSIDEGIRHCKAKHHELEFERVKDARVELSESLTDTPYPGPYDNASRIRIRRAVKEMRDQLTRISFAVNRR